MVYSRTHMLVACCHSLLSYYRLGCPSILAFVVVAIGVLPLSMEGGGEKEAQREGCCWLQGGVAGRSWAHMCPAVLGRGGQASAVVS